MRVERWAFSVSEYYNPANLNREDVLYATTLGLPEGVVVYRNGEVSNQWEDGTVGVPESIKNLVDNVETLYHPEVEEPTDKWLDVQVDRKGDFIRFAGTGK